MDKKVINGLVQSMVEEVAVKYGIEEGEARTFVGVALRLNREAFLSCVQVPTLALAKPVESQPVE